MPVTQMAEAKILLRVQGQSSLQSRTLLKRKERRGGLTSGFSCSGRAKGQVTDYWFANSKDVPIRTAVSKFLPFSGLSTAGLQVPMDNLPGCCSYYQKGPRIGPNRKDQELDSWPSFWLPGRVGPAGTHSSAAPPQPRLCVSRVYSYHSPYIICVQSSPDALHLFQKVKSSKALNAFVGKP